MINASDAQIRLEALLEEDLTSIPEMFWENQTVLASKLSACDFWFQAVWAVYSVDADKGKVHKLILMSWMRP